MELGSLRSTWIVLSLVSTELLGQQVPDTLFHPTIEAPRFAAGMGPVVMLDEAHHNFHTLTGRYRAFATVLRADGYTVLANQSAFESTALSAGSVLVIANALHSRNVQDWRLPCPSAFTAKEIGAVVEWVRSGGALFLIADHMPMAGAAADLGRAFGFDFLNCFAMDQRERTTERFHATEGLNMAHAIIRGSRPSELVDTVITLTGSAFQMPEGADALISLSDHYQLLEPVEAWAFPADTPGRSGAGWQQGAALEFGKGRVVVFGEAAMFSAQLAGPHAKPVGLNQPGMRGNIQLLRNIMSWLSGSP
ncbi:MAG TPA: DUF4350 domain-containing protein [Flavobacteriales bacterium]|jgi:hypothetical protein|nr:DUF4350 domain-containing protein [Flavobacteriales bacterium]